MGGAAGHAEVIRDAQGFAVKFYTEEGNHNFMGNGILSDMLATFGREPTITPYTAYFLYQGPVKFPSVYSSHKKNLRKNIGEPTMIHHLLGVE